MGNLPPSTLTRKKCTSEGEIHRIGARWMNKWWFWLLLVSTAYPNSPPSCRMLEIPPQATSPHLEAYADVFLATDNRNKWLLSVTLEGRWKWEDNWQSAGVGFMWGGSETIPPQLGGLREHCKLPEWEAGQNPSCPTVFLHFKCSRWLLQLHYCIIYAHSSARKWDDYPQYLQVGDRSPVPLGSNAYAPCGPLSVLRLPKSFF